MKALKIISALLIVSGIFISCEKVIDIDLDDSKARLVVEGGLFIYTEPASNTGYQTIQLRTSHPYFGAADADYSVSGATVMVVNNTSGDEYIFTESNLQSGLYEINNLDPELNTGYTLYVSATVGGELQEFIAKDSIRQVAPPMDELSFHLDSTGSKSDNDKELGHLTLVSFLEPQETKDYYKFDTYLNDTLVRNEIDGGSQWILLKRDEHLDEVVDSVIINDYLIPLKNSGDDLRVEMTLITKETYFYLFTLWENAANAGSDFPAAEVKGNIINTTHSDRYGLGYFHCGSRSEILTTVPQ